MSALGDVLRAVSQTFEDLAIPWYVFEAQATAVRGAPRATQDLDVTAMIARPALVQATRALHEGGLVHRFPEIADELLETGAVLPLVHVPSGFEVDLVIAGSGLESLALGRATPVCIDGVEVPVAHATDLVVMKVLAGRGKDLDDVRALLAGGEVDLAEVEDLLSQLEQALGQSDLLPRLDQARRDIG